MSGMRTLAFLFNEPCDPLLFSSSSHAVHGVEPVSAGGAEDGYAFEGATKLKLLVV